MSKYAIKENNTAPGVIHLKRKFWELGDENGKGVGLIFGPDAAFAEHVRDLLNSEPLRNPFLDSDGKESGTFQTGDRLEKAKKFTLQECDAALALQDFCTRMGCHFMNNTVEKAVRARKKQIEKTFAMLGAKL